MAAPVYLADTSVYVLQGRHPAVHARFASLLTEGRLAACQMTALEYLTNAPDPKGYEVLLAALRGYRWIDTTAAAMEQMPKIIPLGRIGTAEEVAGTVRALVDHDRAAFGDERAEQLLPLPGLLR